jgi:ankyrin repeat protein
VRVLLGGGLTANPSGGGRTPLLAATGENCVDTVTLLLDRGADINVKDDDGRTALITAAAGGMTDVVRVLLQRGADMDLEDHLGRTAGMYAATANREEIAALFKEARAKK